MCSIHPRPQRLGGRPRMGLRPSSARWFEIVVSREDTHDAVEALARRGRVQFEWLGARAAASEPQRLHEPIARYRALALEYGRFWPGTGLRAALLHHAGGDVCQGRPASARTLARRRPGPTAGPGERRAGTRGDPRLEAGAPGPIGDTPGPWCTGHRGAGTCGLLHGLAAPGQSPGPGRPSRPGGEPGCAARPDRGAAPVGTGGSGSPGPGGRRPVFGHPRVDAGRRGRRSRCLAWAPGPHRGAHRRP